MFSIIIPLYNKEKSISNTLKSVLNQSYKNFEVIIINDGSTDNSEKSVFEFSDNRIRYFYQENEGVSAARNRGIKLAKKEYIVFLDADDEWDKDYLLTMAKLISDFKEYNIFASAIVHRETSGEMRNAKYSIKEKNNDVIIINDFFSASMANPILSSSSTIIKSDLMKNYTFPIGIKMGEDLDVWCRLALSNSIIFKNKNLVIYNRDSENRACLNNLPRPFPFIEDYKNGNIEINNEGKRKNIEKFILKHQIYYVKQLLINNYILEAKQYLKECNILKYITLDNFKIKVLCTMPNEIIKYLIRDKIKD